MTTYSVHCLRKRVILFEPKMRFVPLLSSRKHLLPGPYIKNIEYYSGQKLPLWICRKCGKSSSILNKNLEQNIKLYFSEGLAFIPDQSSFSSQSLGFPIFFGIRLYLEVLAVLGDFYCFSWGWRWGNDITSSVKKDTPSLEECYSYYPSVLSNASTALSPISDILFEGWDGTLCCGFRICVSWHLIIGLFLFKVFCNGTKKGKDETLRAKFQ